MWHSRAVDSLECEKFHAAHTAFVEARFAVRDVVDAMSGLKERRGAECA